jgi:NinB protein
VSRVSVILTNRATREQFCRWVMMAPVNTVAMLRENKRTIPQNDRMHAMLTDVARQVPIWGGVKVGKDEWKLIFLDGLKREMRLVPNLDGNGVVSLSGKSSSELTKEEMTGMIELIFKFGAEHQVEFNDPESVAARAEAAANNPASEAA